MKLVQAFALSLCLLAIAPLVEAQAQAVQSRTPQLPALYKTLDRLLWVTHDVEHLRATWAPLGLNVVHDEPRAIFTGSYRGKPTTVHAHVLTARLDNLSVEIIQPAGSTDNAFSNFLTLHGDGIFATLHQATAAEQQAETERLRALGVNVLEQFSVQNEGTAVTLFDTEPEGKYVLGLITHPDMASTLPPSKSDITVTHIGTLVKDPKAVAAYWHRLSFPSFSVGTEPQRDDFRYRGQPLALNFGTAAQPFAQITYEWIRAATTPDNLYNDFYKSHHGQEGIQHLGFGVRNLPQAISLFQKAGFTPVQAGHWNGANNLIIPYMGMDGNAATGGVQAELVQAN